MDRASGIEVARHTCRRSSFRANLLAPVLQGLEDAGTPEPPKTGENGLSVRDHWACEGLLGYPKIWRPLGGSFGRLSLWHKCHSGRILGVLGSKCAKTLAR